jgi:hypothetical protein
MSEGEFRNICLVNDFLRVEAEDTSLTLDMLPFERLDMLVLDRLLPVYVPVYVCMHRW